MSELMWRPSEQRIRQTNMYDFMQYVNYKYGREFDEYHQLWEWSINNIPSLWESLWDYMDIIHSAPYREVIIGEDRMPGAEWFPGARLNFAENLLRYRDGRPAIISRNEKGETREITYRDLYGRVAGLARSMSD